MSPPADYSLNDMFAGLAHFQQVLDRVQGDLRNPEDKAKLGELLDQLRKARAEAEEKVPPILQEKLQNARNAKAEMEEFAKQVAQKLDELQAQKKKADVPGTKIPSPPLLPQVPIDPKRGQDLRVELLKAYGGLIIKERFS
jgi:polyhydroxyalkanoate synthesis regulator phasin